MALTAIRLMFRADKIIEKLEDFSFENFENKFLEKHHSMSYSTDVTVQFDNMILQLRKEGREGNAVAYNTAKKALLKFRNKIHFKDVTYDFLKGFENYMIKSNHSYTTVGIYCRHLRAIFNKAINDGIIKSETYPFRKYKIPNSRNIKKALSFDQIKRALVTAIFKSQRIIWIALLTILKGKPLYCLPIYKILQ